MADERRKMKIFGAGCSLGEGAVRVVKDAACPSCDIRMLEMRSPDVRRMAAELGVKSVPAVVIDGKLAYCCAGRRLDLCALGAAGVGQPIAWAVIA